MRLLSYAATLLMFAVPAWSQAPAPETAPTPGAAPAAESAPATDSNAPAAESAAPENTTPPKPKGDVVTLTTGAVLSDVQVLRRTPTDYTLEILGGSVTLDIPRGLVKSVEYDDYNPSDAQSARQKSEQQAVPSEIAAQKLSPELSARLREELAPEPVKYENKDLLEILADFAQRKQISITASEGVQALPKESRLWTLEVAPGTQLFSLLRDKLPQQFPDIEAVFEGNKVIVATKAESHQKGEAAPGDKTPPPAPEAPVPAPGPGAPKPPAAPDVPPAPPTPAPTQ